jgi:predicted lipoprotein with Yx(FWY)xxD motif
MLRTALVILCASALVAAGCGDDDDQSSASPSSEAAMKEAKSESAMKEEKSATAASTAKGTQVKVVSSQFGRVVADRRGEAFYLFAKEKSKRSECYGACAKAWPPVLTKAKPAAGTGARKSLLGTTRRRDGKLQVTYAGHPMYYYEHDRPGRILCHNVNEFGGLWLVVKPNGEAVS